MKTQADAEKMEDEVPGGGSGLVWPEAALLYRDAIERGGQRLNWPSEI